MNIGLGLFPGFVINQEVRGDYFAVFATTSQFTFSIVCIVCIKSGAEKVKKKHYFMPEQNRSVYPGRSSSEGYFFASRTASSLKGNTIFYMFDETKMKHLRTYTISWPGCVCTFSTHCTYKVK